MDRETTAWQRREPGQPGGSHGPRGSTISPPRRFPLLTMSSDLLPVRRALLSVSDKTGLLELARALAARGVELLSLSLIHI